MADIANVPPTSSGGVTDHGALTGLGDDDHPQYALDSDLASYVPTTRDLTAGAGMTGGGTLASDRTFNVVANADGTIVVNANDIQVGSLVIGNIPNGLITLAKIVNIATDSLIGRDTAGTGVPESILLNATLSMDGAGNLQRAALTGDVTASAGSNATTIANDAVTYAKMQNVTTARLMGRATAGSGDMEEITLGTNLSYTGTTLNAAGGGSITVEDQDSSPTVSSVTTLRFDSADGMVVSTPGAGIARVDLSAVPLTVLATQTANTVVANGTGSTATPTACALGSGLAFVSGVLTHLQGVFYSADQLDSPNTSDWSVNAFAPLSQDPTNTGLRVRRFDDTTDEGVGIPPFTIPTGTTSIIFHFMGRAITAPGAARTVGLSLRYRRIQDNTAVSSWSTHALTDIDITTNALFQLDTQTMALTAPTTDLVAGSGQYQFELVRTNPTGGTELTGDYALLYYAHYYI